jgi:hypothetical protein
MCFRWVLQYLVLEGLRMARLVVAAVVLAMELLMLFPDKFFQQLLLERLQLLEPVAVQVPMAL